MHTLSKIDLEVVVGGVQVAPEGGSGAPWPAYCDQLSTGQISQLPPAMAFPCIPAVNARMRK